MSKGTKGLIQRILATPSRSWLRGSMVALCVVLVGLVLYALSELARTWSDRTSPASIAKVARVRAVRMRDWKYIVLHHSATTKGNVASFDTYHRQERKWENGLGYHFVIGNGTFSGDGEVEVGDRWKHQREGAHCGDLNNVAIGICLVGNFEDGQPTPKQIESLVNLVRHLQAKCQISTQNVVLHRQVPSRHTLCPGRNFPFEQVRRLLAETSQPEPAT
jgi:N-acetyl-anhydromuramyl-L-alanine amidase AmpD